MTRLKAVVVAASLGAFSGGAFTIQELRAEGAPTSGDGPQFICLAHPLRPWECAPTWMHNCWCTVNQT